MYHFKAICRGSLAAGVSPHCVTSTQVTAIEIRPNFFQRALKGKPVKLGHGRVPHAIWDVGSRSGPNPTAEILFSPLLPVYDESGLNVSVLQ